MTLHALGTFEVKLIPVGAVEGTPLHRMSIDKRFNGDLSGSSKGEMISSMSDVQGSAGYVALERVTGTLSGRSGSFVLQHYGTMNRGASHVLISVVPDSGTGDLEGITGQMHIGRNNGTHSYDFQYSLSYY